MGCKVPYAELLAKTRETLNVLQICSYKFQGGVPMWTETTEGREYIEEVSKRIVTEFAPEELDLFDDLIAEYFVDPTPPDLSDSGGDDALAFGVGEVLVAVTPAAAAVVTAVLTHVLTEATEVIKEESAAKIKKGIKDIFGPEKKDKQDDDEPQPLTRDQLEQVKKLARRQAKKFGLEPDLANKMADALVGALVLAA
jgi:hypothetical protein